MNVQLRASSTAMRPRALKVAAYLLLLQAVLMLGALGVSLYYGDILKKDTFAGTAAKHLIGQSTEPTVFGVTIFVAAIAVLVALAFFLLRESSQESSRAWIAALLFSFAGTAIGLRSVLGSAAPADDGPRWYEANSVVMTTQLAVLLTYIGVVVCLILHRRASRR